MMRAASLVGMALAAAAWLLPVEAAAYERQWHLGGQVGYTLAGFGNGPFSGLGGGAQLTYGVTDILNLRVHTDLSGYPLPDPLAAALIWNAGAGIEVAFDVLQVVPYIGATVGPAYLHAIMDTDALNVPADLDTAMLSLEAPIGARYYPTRDFSIGGEVRYRALLFAPTGGPVHNMTAFLRMDYVWGY